MMPMYMNSSQHPQAHYCQGFGNYPRHVTMDASSSSSSSSPVSCEHWPTPPPCYGSCFHGNFPAYTPYWSPCYPPQVSPYHSCCGNHLRPHALPPYYIPQPFPVVGYHQPANEFDSGMHRCTKCSPQVCYPKNERGVVIEEHEPEIEKEKQGEAPHSVGSKNCAYPIIWIPHENGRSQGSRDQPPADVKVPENMTLQRSDPKSWSGGILPFDESTIRSLLQNQDKKRIQNGKPAVLPFDISKLRSLLQGGDVKEPQNQKNKEEQGQLPYQIYFIPSQEKREDAEASENRERSDGRNNLKSSPSDLHAIDGHTVQHKGGEGNYEPKALLGAEEKSSMRNIPVEKEPRSIPVKVSENHLPKPTEQPARTAKNEPVENTKKEKSASPPKASRLPPVCLRVDPLPKKRNGGSKSLSPPRRKEQPSTPKETKEASPLSSTKETSIAPEADSNVRREEMNKEKKMSEGCVNAAGTEKESAENDSTKKGADCETVRPSEAKETKEKPAMKTLTEEEAARIIQSTYRGYDVRRWEPIKKLKEIAIVREQMGDVKRRINALQVSTNAQGREKEIVILGEMVMRLLLKLDSVQGLHPSIRDYRKSLARELSGIQDELDSLKKKSVEKEAAEERVEITSQTSQCPVNLELNQLAGENKMVSHSNTGEVLSPSSEDHHMNLTDTTDGQQVAGGEEKTGLSETSETDPVSITETGISEAGSVSVPEENKMVSEPNTEKVLSPSSEEHHMSLMNATDGQQVAEGEKETGLSETLVEVTKDPVAATETSKSEADSTSIPEKIAEVETNLPVGPLSADGDEMTLTNNEDEKVMEVKLEEPTFELSQVVDQTRGPGFEAPEAVVEVSDTKVEAPKNEDGKGDADSILPPEKDVELSELLPVGVMDFEAPENEDGKGDADSVLPPEKDVELSELLPVGVIDDETQLPPRDSISSTREVETTVLDAETESKEETVDNSDDFKRIGQETSEPQEKREQPVEKEVDGDEKSEETRKLMEENQRYKEMVETLAKAGREQLEAISSLTGRVKSLEKKLAQRKKRSHIGRRIPNRGKQSKPMSDAVM